MNDANDLLRPRLGASLRRQSPLVLVSALGVVFFALMVRAAHAPPRPLAPVTREPGASMRVAESREDVPPVAESTPVTSAFASASAPPATPPVPRLADRLAADPPSAEHTPLPTAAEWRAAEKLATDASICSASRVREWVRIACESFSAQNVSVVAGNAEHVHLAIPRKRETWGEGSPIAISVFPVRSGDRRVLIVNGSDTSRYGNGGPQTEAVITETWLEGEEPSILVR